MALTSVFICSAATLRVGRTFVMVNPSLTKPARSWSW
jgi:hypothetical protein